MCTAAFAGDITYQNLLDLILFSASATVPYDLFIMVRVRRVKVWAIPILGAAESVTVIFDGRTAGSQGDREFHTDTSMGIEPAFLSVAPKEKTLASMFQLSSTASCFFLDVPSGAVIDLCLDFHSDVIANGVLAAQNVSVGATIGAIGWRGLDGLAVSTSKFTVPAGLNQI
jgi:hypothetical protein